MQAAGQSEAARTGFEKTGIPDDDATVAVIVPTFNQARFLADAINSVLEQTRPATEIIVVDDGSCDNPAEVVAKFPKVQLLRHGNNRGVAAARNTGLRSCKTSHVVFLDADDRLLPTALETGLICIAARPDCAFVYGGHRMISEQGHPVGADCFWPIVGNAHLALLRGNLLGPPATGLYRRDCVLAIEGFDGRVCSAEDYDLNLRLTQRYQIAHHPEVVAEYRRHDQNVTRKHAKQLKAVLRVLDLHKARIANDPLAQAALREGRALRRQYYVSQMLAATSARWRARHDFVTLMKDLIQAARWSPFLTMRRLLGALARRAS
jgi:glycosyltransferase involved in cell wall biosynthesis